MATAPLKNIDPDILKLEYSGDDPKILKAIADANALIKSAGKLQDRVSAAGYTDNNSSEEVWRLREDLMDARWQALGAVTYARKLIDGSS